MISTAKILGTISAVLAVLAIVSLFIAPSLVGIAAVVLGALGAATGLIVYCIGHATEIVLDRIDRQVTTTAPQDQLST